MLRTSLCVEILCSADCVSYRTPLNECYNGAHLFPGDPSWSDFDIRDEVESDTLALFFAISNEDQNIWERRARFSRYFYATKNGSCGGDSTDEFDDLPLDECVGPFGPPRPWGTFSIIKSAEDGDI